MSFPVGTVIGAKYLLQRPLGVGSAAAAWEAENTLVGRKVAVKILHPQFGRDIVVRGRFLAEARAAARIAHPNVVDVFDIGTAEDGSPFIVMELCNGETLSQIIEERGAMGPGYATDLMLQVLAGLHAAHTLGIVHRDLKPANIMVVHPRPDRPIVKVLDFGIAQGVFADAMEEPGLVFGTAAYMAPEQARGEQVDARADIYSAGAMMYELLTGRPPFEGETATEILARALTEQPARLTDRVPSVPAPLEAVVLAALSKAREGRPRSARDLMERLFPFSTRQGATSILPERGESEAPLPLVGGRPGPAVSYADEDRPSLGGQRRQVLELVSDSSIPPPNRDPHRK